MEANHMKKTIPVIVSIFCIALLVSVATAVPQIQSTPLMDTLKKLTTKKAILEDKLDKLGDSVENLNCASQYILPGIIEFLIALILLIIQIVEALIQFILDIMELGALLEYLIERVLYLIDLIAQFVEWLLGFFNPEAVYFD
jgi:hypothetical protein